MKQTHRIGIVGYGEVGGIFARGLADQPGVASVHAWDIRFIDTPRTGDSAAESPVQPAHDLAELCANTDLIFSAVTASNTLEVACASARHLRPGTFFVDLNSASPGTKRQAAQAIAGAGGHYVEAGVMTSVPPYGIRVPMLLGGPHAREMADLLQRWGMDAQAVSAELGVASAIKMSRSVMIKGLEALVIESYATARFYGVEEHVLPTLQETFPHIDWARQGAYFFSRVVQHGKRRAEEMREAARTVNEAGVEPVMAAAIAAKQDWVADLAREGCFNGIAADAPWQHYADRLLAAAAPRA
ncbi:MAG: DUF1932 domain-containing protein [Comamonas sp.]